MEGEGKRKEEEGERGEERGWEKESVSITFTAQAHRGG